MSDPMQDLLDDPKTYETTEQENARTLRESKKYKKAKPGDKNVQMIQLDNEQEKTSPTQRKAMIDALKDS